jgi:RNA polymerase sigma-70 factor (ECF subfamily)
LGDVLYAGKADVRVPESDWSRLVRSIAEGDQVALHALYERTHRLVYTLVMRITHSRETAEELTLDVYHDVWRRAGSYDAAGGTVLGWIMNQARAIDHLRYLRRQKRVDSHANGSSSEAIEPNSEGAVDSAQRARLLRTVLTVLNPEERGAIEAAFFSELSYSEVAARLGQPLGTVKSRIRAGLLKLRKALSMEDQGP